MSIRDFFKKLQKSFWPQNFEKCVHLHFVMHFFSVLHRKWFENGVTLLILVTVIVVLPLALLPKIGEYHQGLFFSIMFVCERMHIFGFCLLRFPGIHQQYCIPLHVVFYCSGELFSLYLSVFPSLYLSHVDVFISLTGGGKKMVHSLSAAIELHCEPGKDHTHPLTTRLLA